MNINGFSDCLGFNVKSALNKIIDENLCTGNGIMIGKDGKLVFEAYAGFADKAKTRPIDMHTVYRMYSMTKVVTIVAAMQLFEKNAFRMSDPLYKYIPEFKDMYVEDEKGIHKAENTILIKHLLTMTSGLPYGDDYGRYDELALKWKKDLSEGNRWSTQRAAKEVASLPLIFEPGTRYRYGFSFDILGALIEIWSGKSLPLYCAENIFKPLGMRDSGFTYADIDKSKLCDMYMRNENGQLVPADGIDCPIIDCGMDYNTAAFASGGAGLLSTMGDYFKFVRMLALGGSVDGVRILSKKSIELISTPRLNEAQLKDFTSGDPCCFGESFSYGYGVRVLVKPHSETMSNIGEWGWAGALGTWMHIDPKENLFYVYVHQTTPADHVNYVPYLNNAIYSSLE